MSNADCARRARKKCGFFYKSAPTSRVAGPPKACGRAPRGRSESLPGAVVLPAQLRPAPALRSPRGGKVLPLKDLDLATPRSNPGGSGPPMVSKSGWTRAPRAEQALYERWPGYDTNRRTDSALRPDWGRSGATECGVRTAPANDSSLPILSTGRRLATIGASFGGRDQRVPRSSSPSAHAQPPRRRGIPRPIRLPGAHVGPVGFWLSS